MRSEFAVPADLDPVTRHPKAAKPGEPVGMHNATCYGCGDRSPHGLNIVNIAREGFTVYADMPVEPWMEGGPGVIHGGLLSTAFDEVMGAVPKLVAGAAVTGHLEIDYLKPVPVGSVVRIDAELLGMKGRKIYTKGVAHLVDSDEPLAIAHALFITIKGREHFSAYVENSQAADEYRPYFAP